MKKNFLFLVVIALFSLYSCDDDTAVTPQVKELMPAFKVMNGDAEVLTDASTEMVVVNIKEGESLKFQDMTTVGAPTGREWTIEGGTPATSTDEMVMVTFDTEGEFTNYKLKSIRTGDAAAEVVKELKLKVVVAKVIPPLDDLMPAFKVLNGADVVVNEATATEVVVNLLKGESLTFQDVTTVGMPSGRTWTLTGGATATSGEASVTVTYDAVGEFTGYALDVTRTGDQAANVLTDLKLKVIVAEPVVLDLVAAFKVMQGANEVATDETAAVVVVNVDKGESLVFTDLSTVGVPTSREWTLVGGDVTTSGDASVTVTYNTVGEFTGNKLKLMRSDDSAELMKDVMIKIVVSEAAPVTNVLSEEFSGFVAVSTDPKKAMTRDFWVGGANDPDMFYTRVEDMVHSGTAAMKYEFDGPTSANQNLSGSIIPDVTGTASTYKLSFYLYLDADCGITSFRSNIKIKATGPIVTLATHDWDLTTVTKGEWVLMETEVNLVTGGEPQTSFNKLDLLILPTGTADAVGVQKFYIDDYKMEAVTGK